MKRIITKSDSSQPVVETAVYLFDDWFDPIEAGVRDRVRGFIQAMIEGELDETLMRPRYGRRSASSSDKNEAAVAGHRHGHRTRSLTGTFGRTQIAVPRARLLGADGKTTEWKSKVLRTYQRRTLAADALIASAYLAGTNTRRTTANPRRVSSLPKAALGSARQGCSARTRPYKSHTIVSCLCDVLARRYTRIRSTDRLYHCRDDSFWSIAVPILAGQDPPFSIH
jgi:Transposase, Mutator family